MTLIKERPLHPGMGDAVARRTILRKLVPDRSRELSSEEMNCLFAETEDTPFDQRVPFVWETWGEVADRVATGNASLCPDKDDIWPEYTALADHITTASVLLSGRHLQHGDLQQSERNMEVFTNCATSPTTFMLFYLLLNGAGVGRCYDDDLMVVNWDYAPEVRCVLDEAHPDFDVSAHESLRDAKHKYGDRAIWFEVEDTREDWAKAIELWERLTYEKVYKDRILVLDFSKVRAKNRPIAGMQNRPSSGPVPVMNAFNKAGSVCRSGMAKWKQTLYIDHYFAECVLVGGARRAARMSTKWWKDSTIFDFINVKRPTEYLGLSRDEVIALRKRRAAAGDLAPGSFLWSSNNSILVDQEFWTLLNTSEYEVAGMSHEQRHWWRHARAVFELLTDRSYGDGTGEPGLLNAHKMVQNDDGLEDLTDGRYVGSRKYQLDVDTERLLAKIARVIQTKAYYHITNPCGEITLALFGAFCVIGDVVPFHCDTLNEAEDAFRVTTRALIRTNLMESVYSKEVKRTNRIGVGITGVHEFAWKFFKCTFRDLIDPDFDGVSPTKAFTGRLSDCEHVAFQTHESPRIRAAAFWATLARFNRAVREEAAEYSSYLGLEVPHTALTIKPAGTTSKLFGLTEGWHLPSMVQYLRWVQFRNDDPLIKKYEDAGYPTRALKSYEGTTIVGFPTAPVITQLGVPEDQLVTAAQATPAEQFRWLQLGEQFWIVGVDDYTSDDDHGNQISYTLKYDPEAVDFSSFRAMMKTYLPTVRACSVMPQTDMIAYEYQPEQAVMRVEYDKIIRGIKQGVIQEDVGAEHIDCDKDGGMCPTNFDKSSDAAPTAE